MRIMLNSIMILFLSTSVTYAIKNNEQVSSSHFLKPTVNLTPEEIVFFKNITELLKKSFHGVRLLQTAEQKNFQFGGFLSVSSDAITLPASRIIKLSPDSAPEVAVLNLAYELVNVKNSSQYCRIIQDAKEGKIEREAYAKKMIYLEAEAVLGRSVVADELGLYHLDSFRCVVQSMDQDLQIENKIEYIAKDMMRTGMVIGIHGKQLAKLYYMEQYDRIL